MKERQQIKGETKMIKQTVHLQNVNLVRLKDHPEKHAHKIILDGPGAFRIENVGAGVEKVAMRYCSIPDLKLVTI
jgi:hypothetical protein